MPLLERLNTLMPSSRSRSRTATERLDWETNRERATEFIEPLSAIAMM